MDLSKEYEMRKRLIMELRGLLHNLKHNSEEYRMTQKVLQEIRRTETGVVKIMCRYAEYFENSGIFVRELFEDIV